MRHVKFGVTSKLFLAFLLTNVAIALVVAVAAQIAVKTGFRSYVNEREERRLSTLSDTLVDAYRAHGDWEFLRGNDSLWRSFNRPGPPGPERFAPDGRPPPHANDRSPPPASERHGPPPGEGPPRPRSVPPTATLLDAERHLIAGKDVSPDTSPLRPIIVDGATVGWIATTYPGEPFDPAPPSAPDLDQLTGRGRFLMAALMDTVEYTFPPGETIVRLAKRLR